MAALRQVVFGGFEERAPDRFAFRRETEAFFVYLLVFHVLLLFPFATVGWHLGADAASLIWVLIGLYPPELSEPIYVLNVVWLIGLALWLLAAAALVGLWLAGFRRLWWRPTVAWIVVAFAMVGTAALFD